MVELRAEDVKEALDAIEVASPENMDGTRGVFVAAPSLDQMVAVIEAAHAWLASQATTEGRYVEPAGSSEQTPEQIGWCVTHRQHAVRDAETCQWAVLADAVSPVGHHQQACIIEVRALVGFHPQPEGDKGDER